MSVVLNFSPALPGKFSEVTVPWPGASDGDVVALGIPSIAMAKNAIYTAWVSAADNITIRFTNNATTSFTPRNATFKLTILK